MLLYLHIYAPMMTYITLCNYLHETHPFETYIPENCRVLTLGTFPAKKKDRRFSFFYPSARNRFWEVMGKVSGIAVNAFEDPMAARERKHILDKLELGLADLGKRVLRQGDSSMDINIFPIDFQDIFALIDRHPSIKYLVLTSKSKGNSATDWFKAYCKLNSVNFKIDKKAPYPHKIELKTANRTITVVVLPSTSTACPYSTDELIAYYSDLLLHSS